MRDFATFLPRFWTTGPGKRFRGDLETQLVCIYLFTAPGSNHIGIYYLPIETIAHDVGITLEGASKGLRRGFEGAFCFYDDLSEHVFVVEMAQIQILERAESLKPTDKKIIGVKKELIKYKESIYFQPFIDRYRNAFHLTEPEFNTQIEAPSKGLARGFEGASKGHPLRDRDRDRDRDRERDRNLARVHARETHIHSQNNFTDNIETTDRPPDEVPKSILEAQARIEKQREELRVENERNPRPEIGEIIDSFVPQTERVNNAPKHPLQSDPPEIDWTIARDIFSTVRSRYGFGTYKPNGFGKYSDHLSDVANWANSEPSEWSARELVEISAAGFVVSANEKTKEAKYHPGFWWGDPGAHLSAGYAELKRWEIEIKQREIDAIRETGQRDHKTIKRIESLIDERKRLERELSSFTT